MNSRFADTLVIIPARGGSKGIPGKNIKLLGNKPLIAYSIDLARELVDESDICLSTDSPEIISTAESYGIKVPFVRPEALASDTAGSNGVLLHALEYYRNAGRKFGNILLLQPTSPFRTVQQVNEAFGLYDPSLDMVVSVTESSVNPYYNLFEENAEGYLGLSKPGNYVRRQDCPKVYEYNGAIYIINIESLKKMALHEFVNNKKYIMDKYSSVDLDQPEDWMWAEYLLEKGLVKIHNA